jgi:hypothetical protein
MPSRSGLGVGSEQEGQRSSGGTSEVFSTQYGLGTRSSWGRTGDALSVFPVSAMGGEPDWRERRLTSDPFPQADPWISLSRPILD